MASLVTRAVLTLFVFLSLTFYTFGLAQDSLRISKITIIGNTKTKAHIIERELTFSSGQMLLEEEMMAEFVLSRGNLINTLLFNFITINPLIEGTNVVVFITVAERWYTWPIPIFDISEPNVNQWFESKNLDRASYGLFVAQENFRGRRESIRAQIQLGYQRQFGVSYSVPYLNKKERIGVTAAAVYRSRNEALYGTSDNKRLFYKSDGPVFESFDTQLRFRFRNKFYIRHEGFVKYTTASISDSLEYKNPTFLNRSGGKNQSYLSLGYRFRFNKTDYVNYPTRGMYAEFQAVQRGLGILNKSNDLTLLSTWIRAFKPLSNRVFYSTSFTGVMTLAKTQPYIFQTSIGYREHIRGFEYYIIDTQHYGILKNQFKWALVPQDEVTSKLIPIKKFQRVPYAVYLGVFNDAGYAYTPIHLDSPKTNQWITGYGMSLDFVTYYDRILRIEYSFNNFAESGIFVHFTTPI